MVNAVRKDTASKGYTNFAHFAVCYFLGKTIRFKIFWFRLLDVKTLFSELNFKSGLRHVQVDLVVQQRGSRDLGLGC